MNKEYEKDFLDDVIDAVEENLDYEGFCGHSDNCEVSAFIPYNQRKSIKKILIKILGDKCLCDKLNKIKEEMMVNEL